MDGSGGPTLQLNRGHAVAAADPGNGAPAPGWRITGALMGLMLYVYTARWAWRALSELWPGDLGLARRASRIAWSSATLGAALAALFYRGIGFADLRATASCSAHR